jgi:RNA polymerase sigma-70 factor (ECF subfamily)
MPEPHADVADFERLLRETYRMVYQIAWSVLANAADAEDVTQEAFLRAYQKFSSLRDAQKFRPWVARMSWRLALNRQRADSRARGRDGAWFAVRRVSDDPETQAAGREFESCLRQNIARLPEKLRSVLLLSAVQGLDARAVAAILEIPEGTVRSRLHLARRRLLEAFLP